MKLLNLKSVAAVLAASAFAGNVLALAPSTTPAFVLNISGASAQQEPLEQLLTDLCVDGSLDTFLSEDDGDEFRSFFCNLDPNNSAVPASLANAPTLINNRARGGSIWGVVPVARQWAVEYMNIFSGSCTQRGTTPVWDCTTESNRAVADEIAECPFVPYNPVGGDVYTTLVGGGVINGHVGTNVANTACIQSDGGVSDVEAALFSDGSNFAFAGQTPLTTTELAGLTTVSEYGVIFGFSVTDNAYQWMQQLQGLVDYDDGNAATSLADDIKAAAVIEFPRPNMSKAAIRSLMSGALGSFQALDQRIIAPNAATSGLMGACRRNVGSGTQAANQEQFLQTVCLGSSGLPMVAVTGGVGNNFAQFDGASIIVEHNSSSGGVENCQNEAIRGLLVARALGAVPQTTDLDDVASVPGQEMDAWGFNAITRNKSGDDWYFVSVDGADPNPNAPGSFTDLEPARLGFYDHVYEQTLQYVTAAVSAETQQLLDGIAINSGNPQNLIGTIEGVLALPTNGFNFEDGTDRVWRGSRSGNSCNQVTLSPDAP